MESPAKNVRRSVRPEAKTEAWVWAVAPGHSAPRLDQLATEEPLEIRLRAAGLAGGRSELPVFHRRGQGGGQRTVAITMRTPGNDFELAVGFLYGEGVIRGAEDIRQVTHCDDPALDDARRYNIVNVDLRGGVLPDLEALERHFYTTSACGVCGKASLDSLRLRGCPVIGSGPEVDPDALRRLPEKLRAAQGIFTATGGLHAAGLFDAAGNLLAVREDVGRHNAVDKLVGWALFSGGMPLSGHTRSSAPSRRRAASRCRWPANSASRSSGSCEESASTSTRGRNGCEESEPWKTGRFRIGG
jgi:FdhD protein